MTSAPPPAPGASSGDDKPVPVWQASAEVRRAGRKAQVRTGRRDVDAAHRARLFKAAIWSSAAGLIGFLVGGPLLGVVLWAVAFSIPIGVSALGGRAAQSVYNPSGRTTPHKREHSFAQSLVARGLYEEAIAAFEEAVAEDPSDSTPYLRIARLARDELSDDERAAVWFRRGLAESHMHSGLVLLTLKEFLELCEVRMGVPKRAAPVLARVATDRPDTQEGEWAAGELKRIKERMATESDTA